MDDQTLPSPEAAMEEERGRGDEEDTGRLLSTEFLLATPPGVSGSDSQRNNKNTDDIASTTTSNTIPSTTTTPTTTTADYGVNLDEKLSSFITGSTGVGIPVQAVGLAAELSTSTSSSSLSLMETTSDESMSSSAATTPTTIAFHYGMNQKESILDDEEEAGEEQQQHRDLHERLEEVEANLELMETRASQLEVETQVMRDSSRRDSEEIRAHIERLNAKLSEMNLSSQCKILLLFLRSFALVSHQHFLL